MPRSSSTARPEGAPVEHRPARTSHDNSRGTPITIVGSGVMGLSCAFLLGRAGFATRIVSARPTETTHSAEAGAFWYPFHAGPAARVYAWAQRSYEFFRGVARLGVPGLTRVEALELLRRAGPPSPWARIADGLRPTPTRDLPAQHVCGYYFQSFAIDPLPYLNWLRSRVRAQGTTFYQRRLTGRNALQQLADTGEVVINTAGLGARELAADPAISPMYGQLRVHPRTADRRLIIDENAPNGPRYVIPHAKCTVLGASFEAELNRSRAADVRRQLLAECRPLIRGRLRSSPQYRVGVRPHRPEVRLEIQPDPYARIVHNYGHGGAGFTLSWGCAHEVVELVRTLQLQSS